MSAIEKLVKDSLSFLNVPWVRWALIVLVILYIAGLVPMFPHQVATVFQNPIVHLLFLLFIVYIALKDLPLALLLAIAFVVSLLMGFGVRAGASLGPGFGFQLGGGITRDSRDVAQAQIGAKVEPFLDQNGDIPHGGDYNRYFDCVKDCADGDVGTGSLSQPCDGVALWNPELNAQGLNCPLGYSGQKTGSPF